MAFSVAYCNNSKRPYEDWMTNRHMCSQADFKYREDFSNGSSQQGSYEVEYFPAFGILFCMINTLPKDGLYDCYVLAYAKIEVEPVTRKLCVKAATTFMDKKWQAITGSESCWLNGTGFLRHAIDYYRDVFAIDIFGKMAHVFFGAGWEFLPMHHGELTDTDIACMVHWPGWVDFSISSGQTVAYYNCEREAAATRIQAAFRGWRVRMQYRYSPHNRLGRFLILRSAGFDAS